MENNEGRIIRDKRGNENKRRLCLRVCYSLYISFRLPLFSFRLGGRAGQQSQHPEADLPGPLSARQRNTRRWENTASPLIDMHAKSQRCAAGKFSAVLIPFFPEPQNRGTSVLRTSLLWRERGREREERGNAEKEGKGTGQERGKTGVGVDLKQHNVEAERVEVGGGGGWTGEERARMSSFDAALFASRWLLGFLVYLTQFFFFIWLPFCVVNGVMALSNPFYAHPITAIYLIIPLSLV